MAPGWGSLIAVTMMMGGSQLVFIGLMGQYVARMFEELKGRPMYILKQEPPPPPYRASAVAGPVVEGARLTVSPSSPSRSS